MLLIDYIDRYDISRPDAARALGVPYRTFVNWTNHLRRPSPKWQDHIFQWTKGYVTARDWDRHPDPLLLERTRRLRLKRRKAAAK